MKAGADRIRAGFFSLRALAHRTGLEMSLRGGVPPVDRNAMGL